MGQGQSGGVRHAGVSQWLVFRLAPAFIAGAGNRVEQNPRIDDFLYTLAATGNASAPCVTKSVADPLFLSLLGIANLTLLLAKVL